jgi:glycosyl-4,4'-diaponeurosporenoate acyltransferase
MVKKYVKVFKNYLILLFILVGLVGLVNTIVALYNPWIEIWRIWVICISHTLFIIFLDAIAATITHALPESWFEPTKRIYHVSKGEVSFLETIGIKKWKGWVPETGEFAGFKKNHMYDASSPEYIHKFLVETCYAEWVHYSMMIPSIIDLFMGPTSYIVPFFIWFGLINIFLNLLPSLIQRWVRPKMLRYYIHMTKNKTKDEVIA